MINNFKNNNRRNRFKPNGDRGFRRNGNGHKSNGDFSNGSSFKRRHPGKNNQNAGKLVEKYNDLAREALLNIQNTFQEFLYPKKMQGIILKTQQKKMLIIKLKLRTTEK